jgi:hypothetical protein
MWPSASPSQVYMNAFSALGATIARLDCALQKRTTQASKREKALNIEK